MFPNLIDGETISVIGPVASGKTFLLKQWLDGLPRVAVFDPTAEYDDIPGEHFWASPKKFVEYLRDHPTAFRAFYHPKDTEEGFTHFTSGMWQLLEPRWMFIEEIHELINPWSKHDSMKLVMKYARKRYLGVVGSSQRLADLHKDFTSASRMTVLFYTTEARDLQAIEERWGPEARDHVTKLRPLVYDDASGVTKQIPQALVIRRAGEMSVEEMTRD